MVYIRNLSFRYKKRKLVLDNLDLELTPGSIYGLLGRNGAGKSSLLYNLCGLLYPEKGIIRVLDDEPVQRNPHLLQKLFLLPEEFYLPNVNIKTYLATNAPFYKTFDNEAFYKCLADFDVDGNVNLQSISYGQQKKVVISFALATRAKIILMDEPTNGLDIPSKRQFRKIIAGTLHDDQIIVISTHQVKDLDSLIDFVLILDDKKIILHESVDSITRKLLFKQVMQEDEVKDLIYSEGALRGYATVSLNKTGELSKFDMEMFFNALIVEKNKLVPLFK